MHIWEIKFEKEIAPFVHLSDVSIDEKRIHDGILCRWNPG